jgi:hypothetical protein
VFGIFQTKNASQWKALPGNNSLNLIWIIHSIYIRSIRQDVYIKEKGRICSYRIKEVICEILYVMSWIKIPGKMESLKENAVSK